VVAAWLIGVWQSEGRARGMGVERGQSLCRPGTKPMWSGLFPGLTHQAPLYVAPKLSASAIVG
jgi:hypothetical protein